MIPKSNIDDKVFQERLKEYEGRKFNSFDFKLTPQNTISGHVDDVDAVAQAAYFILSTERFQYVTMSDNTGVELWGLYGETSELLDIALKERIEGALLYDDRIESIEDFYLEHKKRGVYIVRLNVISNAGDIIPIESEVSILGDN